MAADKTILQLPAASSLSVNDKGVIVQTGVTDNFSLQLLLDFLSTNLPTGSNITFGTTIPTGGANGDVYVKTDTNQLWQKATGTWGVFYTFPSAGSGTTVLYGVGVPASTTGNNGDTYINTGTGIFYLKTTGAWAQVYSMATGPQGPQGIPGPTGDAGADGKTVLSGATNPSNSTDGTNGDYYINYSTWQIFGPKAAGVWPTGVSLVGTVTTPTAITKAAGTALPIVLASFQTLYSAYGRFPKIKAIKVNGGGSFDYLSGETVSTTEVTTGIPDSVSINVDDDGTGVLAHDIILIISVT